MNERQQKVMANIVDICSFVIATTKPSQQKYLLEVLREENRAIFVSLVFHLVLATRERRVEPQIEFAAKELVDALNPKRHWVEERDFIRMVLSAVKTKLPSSAPR